MSEKKLNQGCGNCKHGVSIILISNKFTEKAVSVSFPVRMTVCILNYSNKNLVVK